MMARHPIESRKKSSLKNAYHFAIQFHAVIFRGSLMQLSIFLLLEQREDQQIIWMISSLWRCSKPIVMGCPRVYQYMPRDQFPWLWTRLTGKRQ